MAFGRDANRSVRNDTSGVESSDESDQPELSEVGGGGSRDPTDDFEVADSDNSDDRDSSSDSSRDYPNPLEGDDPARGSAAGGDGGDSRDLGSSISDDERDRLQEQRRQEDRVDELDPTREDSPGGSSVGSRETERYLAAAREAGIPIRNVDDNGAIATQIERQTGVDARELARNSGGRNRADVSLDVEEGVFRTSYLEEMNRETRQRQRQRQRTSANDGLVAPGVAGAANRGAFGRQMQTPSEQRLPVNTSTPAGLLEQTAYNRQVAEARRRARQADAEQFGDLDTSFGLGSEGDDVEQFLREQSGEFEQFATNQVGDVDAREEFVSDVTGGLIQPGDSEPSENFERSVAAQGRTLAGFNPADAGLGVVEGVETTAYLVDPLTEGDVEEFEARSAALGAAGLAAGSAAVTSARENPGRALETVGAIGTGGYLGGRALSAAPSAVRTARVRAGASDRVDLAEITDERGVEGDLPNFETDPNAPTSEAVEEIRTRAADNPDDVTDVLGTDQALFQSTEADLGPEFSARRGSSELPGLFTSPDASPLRLSGSGATSGGFSPRLIRLSDLRGPRDRFAAFEGDRIEGFPESATGSGRIPDGAGGYEPDPSTSGAQFLDESAEEGTAFVRPQGGRTTELEAIFPPGSSFRQSDTLAVDLPSGRSVPLDVFQRADADDVLAGARADDIGDGLGGGASTADDIAASLRRSSRRDRADGDPLAPTSGGFSSSGSTGLSAGSTGTGLSSSVFGTSSGSGFGSSGGSSGFGSGSGFGSSGGSFFGSSSTPFGDPSSVFGSGSSTPFGSPEGSSMFGDPTTPPSTPPTTPGGSTTTTPNTPPPSTPPTTRVPPDGDNELREDDLLGLDATEDLFSSGIQSGDELLEDFEL